MHAFSFDPRTAPHRRSLRPGFNVVIVYEDFATGKRAHRGCRFLADELGSDGEFNQSLWRFDILQDPWLKTRAVRDVAQADLLILSVHREVPVEFGGLLDAWLAARKSRDGALVAVTELEDPFGCPPSSAAARLEKFARHHQLDFLEQVVEAGRGDRRVRGLTLVWVF